MTKGYRMLFWGREDVLNSIVVIVAQLCEHTKIIELYTSNKWIVCELCPNKAVTPQKEKVVLTRIRTNSV